MATAAKRGGTGESAGVQARRPTNVYLPTRFVLPLSPRYEAPKPIARLNPIFESEAGSYMLAPQLASAVPLSELGEQVWDLRSEHIAIVGALDMLLSGF
jgi:toxin CcdB